jgi:hypothetical protein
VTPLQLPCRNHDTCRGYTDQCGALCSPCQRRLMQCPNCGTLPDVRVRGKAYQVRKRTRIKQRYAWISKDEVLYFRPIPLLIVERK